jgi:hypothetical protein
MKGRATEKAIRRLVVQWHRDGVTVDQILVRLNPERMDFGDQAEGLSRASIFRFIQAYKKEQVVDALPQKTRGVSTAVFEASLLLHRMVRLAPMLYLAERKRWLQLVLSERGNIGISTIHK